MNFLSITFKTARINLQDMKISLDYCEENTIRLECFQHYSNFLYPDF